MAQLVPPLLQELFMAAFALLYGVLAYTVFLCTLRL